MSSIKKVIMIDGKEHFIEINSSLELNEIEITATEPLTNKVVHISLNSILSPIKKSFEGIEQNKVGGEQQIKQTNIFESEQDTSKFINEIFG
ncbi:MAG: hypothetical protein N3D10_02345 [Candidatus Micrarchaeota archaeon]|nr:hypothetical protein [Candidatus Micrarchaeota archaeon]